jgi:hypothetical protein
MLLVTAQSGTLGEGSALLQSKEAIAQQEEKRREAAKKGSKDL